MQMYVSVVADTKMMFQLRTHTHTLYGAQGDKCLTGNISINPRTRPPGSRPVTIFTYRGDDRDPEGYLSKDTQE